MQGQRAKLASQPGAAGTSHSLASGFARVWHWFPCLLAFLCPASSKQAMDPPPADSTAAIDACAAEVEVVLLNLLSPGSSRAFAAVTTPGSAPQRCDDSSPDDDARADEPHRFEAAALDAWNLRVDQWRALATRGPQRIRARKPL